MPKREGGRNRWVIFGGAKWGEVMDHGGEVINHGRGCCPQWHPGSVRVLAGKLADGGCQHWVQKYRHDVEHDLSKIGGVGEGGDIDVAHHGIGFPAAEELDGVGSDVCAQLWGRGCRC
jgi:hypothetical protein